MILEKIAEWHQAILAAIQFRMLHVLIYRTDIFLSFCVGVKFCVTSPEEHIERL